MRGSCGDGAVSHRAAGLDSGDYECNLTKITDVIAMQISEAESVVMQVLWKQQPLTAEEIHAAIGTRQAWQAATVKTLLNRLLKKGAIAAERDGRRFLYSPVLTRAAWLQGESESLLDRLFGGRVAPLVAHFSERRKLSKKDLAELRKLVQELDDEQ
jgi:BlaI family penicillinase repressor